MQIPGIILAAGASRRMGRPKALISLDGRAFVAIAVDVLACAGLHPRVVVTRADLADGIAGCVGEGARVVVNPAPERGMASSLLAGLGALEEERGDWPGFALVLVDQPRISVAVVRRLAGLFLQHPDCIVLPSSPQQGRGGHPVFFPWACVSELRALPPEQGPNALVRRDPGRVLRVEVDEGAFFEDVDTPQDLERLRQGGTGAPGP